MSTKRGGKWWRLKNALRESVLTVAARKRVKREFERRPWLHYTNYNIYTIAVATVRDPLILPTVVAQTRQKMETFLTHKWTQHDPKRLQIGPELHQEWEEHQQTPEYRRELMYHTLVEISKLKK